MFDQSTRNQSFFSVLENEWNTVVLILGMADIYDHANLSTDMDLTKHVYMTYQGFDRVR